MGMVLLWPESSEVLGEGSWPGTLRMVVELVWLVDELCLWPRFFMLP